MKTRLLIICIVVLSFSFNLNAQLSWGIRGGVTSSNINLSNNTGSDYKIDYNKGGYGWHAGLIGKLKAASFFIQPELLFSTSKVDLAYKDLRNSANNKLGELKIRKLDLPVMLGFKVAAFKFQAGPIATLVLASESDLLDEKKIDQNLKSTTFGYQAGLGVELNALLIDFKYEGNLSKLSDGMDINGTGINTDQRMSQFVFSIGYLF
jgi:hypothetical protein